MAERPFPPSPRRRALAQQAGLHAASPLVTGAAAALGLLLALATAGPGLARSLGDAIVAAASSGALGNASAGPAAPSTAAAAAAAPFPAVSSAAASSTAAPVTAAPSTAAPSTAAPVTAAPSTAAPSTAAPSTAAPVTAAPSTAAPSTAAPSTAAPSTAAPSTAAPVTAAPSTAAAAAAASLPRTVLAAVLPLLGVAAALAALAHLAQTRAVWLPRRKLRGAPALDGGPMPRARRAAGELAAALGLAAVVFGWLWRSAPQLAALPSRPPTGLLAAVAGLLIALATAIAVTWVAAGALDAIARQAAVARALAMTSADKREDDRLAGADPRWQTRRAQLARQVAPDEAIAGASFLLLGDDAAVAIAWDPARRPVPTRTAAGRGARATQLLGLARRRQLAIHRDPALAAALLALPIGGPIPERHWPRLAELVAAVDGRTDSRVRGRDRQRPAP